MLQESMSTPTKDRLVPYKLLAYLLYSGPRPWLQPLGGSRVRLRTGEASRFFRLKSSLLWQALYWLEEHELLEEVAKERKRGTAVLTLKPSTNVAPLRDPTPDTPHGDSN